MRPRHLHRIGAGVLGAFAVIHLGNHLAGIAGQEVHGQVQAALRTIYRQPLIEPLLVLAVVTQIVSGLRLALPRLRHGLRANWGGAQTLAGLYLALFLTIHVAAVLAARAQGAETDLAFAATAFKAGGLWPWVFAPYYGLAVLALGLHLSAPLARRQPHMARALTGVAVLTSGALVLLLAGLLTPISIPAAQIAAFPLMP